MVSVFLHSLHALFWALFLSKLWRKAGIALIPSIGGMDIHKIPTPACGGSALAISIGAYMYLGGQGHEFPNMILLPAGAVFLLGLTDDLKKARSDLPIPRLGPAMLFAVESLIAIMAFYLQGAGFGDDSTIRELFLFLLWFHLIVNGTNMLDGLDGLAGAVTLAGACGMLLAFPAARDICLLKGLAIVLPGILALNMAGGILMLGNSGARLIGAILAITTFQFLTASPRSFAATGLILFPLLFETVFSSARRLYAGRAPWKGDLEHIYNLLYTKWGKKIPVLLIYSGCAVLFSIAGFLVIRIRP